MKVTYFINQYPHVSHTFVRREILALENLGIEVQRVSLRGWDSDIVDSTDKKEQTKTTFLLKSGVLSLLPSLLTQLKKSPKKLFQATKLAMKMVYMSERNFVYHLIYLIEACKLAELTQAENSQHVHAHFGTNSTEVVMLAKILTGIPYSFTVHGPEEYDKPLSLHLKEKIKHASFVAAITSFGRSQLFRWAEFSDWEKIQIVRCGLDDNFLQGSPSIKQSNDHRTLLCIGRLCEQKGQLLLLKGLKQAIDNGSHISLILAGDGDMRPEVERYVQANQLQNHVTITGWISSEQVKQHLLESDAMILPSFAEGLPVAIMEAMAIGRPVLTTYIAGIPELITHNHNGILFPAGDVNAIANAIIDFSNMPQGQLEAMVENAYSSVAASHDVSLEAAKLAQLFRGYM